MQETELIAWRRRERERLVAARLALDAASLRDLQARIEGHLARGFPGLGRMVVGLCWPIRNEFDARHLAKRLRERGATTALPVVIAPQRPLEFREWHPGVEMAVGALGIHYPKNSRLLVLDAVLVPMNGWDEAGYRLGYGGGFFDRTLAASDRKPVAIGVSFELARMPTIRPQRWDIPMDWVVTERGVYRRDAGGLAFLGEVPAGEPSALASPVCYAGEIAPGYFGEPKS